jgi:hypothetical protein
MATEKKAGRPQARPDGEKPLTVRLPTDLYRLLKGVASLKGLSLNEAATEALSDWSVKYPALVEAIRAELANEAAPEESPAKKPAKKPAAKKPSKH